MANKTVCDICGSDVDWGNREFWQVVDGHPVLLFIEPHVTLFTGFLTPIQKPDVCYNCLIKILTKDST